MNTNRRFSNRPREFDRLIIRLGKIPAIRRLFDILNSVMVPVGQRVDSWERSRVIKSIGPEQFINLRGSKFRLDLTNPHDYAIFKEFARGSEYEMATVNLLVDNLREGDVFVDVGANNGFFSSIASRCVGTQGRIIAFEPNPTAYNRLRRNILSPESANTMALPVALFSCDGHTTLYSGERDDAQGTLIRTRGKGVQVPVARFDSLNLVDHVDMIKIDIEGSELEAIKGMWQTIQRSRHLKMIVEWNWSFNDQSLLDVLLRQFSVYEIRDSVSSGYSLAPALTSGNLPRICNLWCVRRETSSGRQMV